MRKRKKKKKGSHPGSARDKEGKRWMRRRLKEKRKRGR